MTNIRLVIEYDGGAFHGWQKQPGVRTVQQSLHQALERVLREKIRVVQGAGRTDSGVHARGQVVNFHVNGQHDLRRLRLAVSGILRGELSVVSAEEVDDSFHATRDAVEKQYSYQILNRDVPAALDYQRVWFVSSALNFGLMQEEAAELLGRHDFSSFRASDCTARSSEREITHSAISKEGDLITYTVRGKGFLKHMVRNIVGTLVKISSERFKTPAIKEILEARDRKCAGPKAPAYGLCLDWVRY
jgi:tRNA pseudouridine38-40 synthase